MIPYLIQKHSEGKFPVEEFVTFYEMKDYGKAFEDMRSGQVVKPVLRFK